MRISCMSTGMGTDNVEIVLAEVMEITDAATFIRIGSSGALQPEIALGDLIVSIGAVRLENTTDFYVHPGYPADRPSGRGLGTRSGLPTARVPVPRGPDSDRERLLRSAGNGRCARSPFAILSSRRSFAASAWRTSRWNRRHSSCWRHLAGLRSGTVCAAYAQRTDGTFLEGAAKEAAEARCIDAGLAGIHLLWQVDTGGGDTLAARGAP